MMTGFVRFLGHSSKINIRLIDINVFGLDKSNWKKK